jgi:hypothetical protein
MPIAYIALKRRIHGQLFPTHLRIHLKLGNHWLATGFTEFALHPLISLKVNQFLSRRQK